MDNEVSAPVECTSNCGLPTPLEESTERVDDLKQQIQCWRQRYDKCEEQVKVLDNFISQMRPSFFKENEALRHQLVEKDTLLSQEKETKDHLQLQLDSLQKEYELKQHEIDDLEYHLQDAKHKINENSNLLKNAEEAYKKQLMDSAQSTHSAGIITSEVESGCRACVQITEELDDIKREYDKIKLENMQLTESLHEQMRNQYTKQHTITDLKRCLKQAECKADENLRHNTQLTEEKNTLQSHLQIEKQKMNQVTEELNALKIHLDETMKNSQQITEENSDLRSELDVRKKEHKNMIQWITSERNMLEHQLEETRREFDKKSSLLEHETKISVATVTRECRELKQKNQQQELTITDLEHSLEQAECKADKNLKQNIQLTEENKTLQSHLQVEKQNMDQLIEELRVLKIHHDKAVKDSKQMEQTIIQKTEENSHLQSELDVRKKEHKNMTQITNERDALKCQLEEARREFDEHAESKLRMLQIRLKNISKFYSSTGLKIRNGCRVYKKQKVKLGKKPLTRYANRCRRLRGYKSRVPCGNSRNTRLLTI